MLGMLLTVLLVAGLIWYALRVAAKSGLLNSILLLHEGELPDAKTHEFRKSNSFADAFLGSKAAERNDEDLELEELPAHTQDGVVYIGQWGRSSWNGTGKLEGKDGGTFQGHFKDGYADGEGKLTVQLPKRKTDGLCESYFEGQWKDNQAHGKGTYVHGDGSRYTGQWLFDRKSGSGEETLSNSKYTGNFLHGMKHGQGKYEFVSGLKYEGQLCRDKMHGTGIYTFRDGKTYEGEWRHGMMHGTGKITRPSGDSFKGHFNQNVRTGKFTFTWPIADGRRLEGECNKDGVLHGTGCIVEGMDRTPREWRDGRAVAQLMVGDHFVVLADFCSSQGRKFEKCQRGVVMRIDKDSEALVKCGLKREQDWIKSMNFHNLLVIKRPSKKWSVSCTHGLCKRGEESEFLDRCMLLDRTRFTGVAQAVQLLNSPAGARLCTEGYCVVFSEKKEQYFLLWREDAADKAGEEFNVDLKAIKDLTPEDNSPPRSVTAMTLRKGLVVRIHDESLPKLFHAEGTLHEYNEEERTWVVWPTGSSKAFSVSEESLVESDVLPEEEYFSKPNALGKSPECRPGWAYLIKVLGADFCTKSF